MKGIYKIQTLSWYQPRWMFWVAAILSIVEGLVDFCVLPFGYRCDITARWASYMIKYAFERRKEKLAMK